MENTSILFNIIQFLSVIVIFVVLLYGGRLLLNKLKETRFKDTKFLNPEEYFPQETLSTLKQLYYLVMTLIFIIISLYLMFDWSDGSYYILILDIIISIYLYLKMSRDSYKDYIILFFLIPVGSIVKLFIGDSILILFDILHIIGYVYFIEVYYRKFLKFTERNGLGIAIILLFSIVLVSFLFTLIAEQVSPLDSIVMVSNAFTSNSFDASGNSVIGKLDSLLLAWGGYLLSFVGTATLSVSIIRRYVDRQFDDIEELIKNKKKDK